MTLLQLTNYITQKVGQTDDDTVAFCKLSINSNYQQIWDSQPWRDSLALVACPTPSVLGTPWVVFPQGIERVLSVRWDPNTALSPMDAVTVMDYNSELWNDGGTPIGFTVFPPVVMGPFDPTQLVKLSQTSGDDPFGQDSGLNFYSVLENKDGTYSYVNTTFEVGQDSGDQPLSEPGNSQFLLSFSCDSVTQDYAVICGTSLVVIIAGSSPGNQQGGLNSTEAPRCARIRLLQYPTTANTVLAVCKRTFMPLVADSDAPQLTNMDNALIALTMADLLERNRQYGKAQAKNQEAAQQIQIMADLERKQTASQTRIIPADIHGSVIVGGFGSEGKGYW